MTRLAALGSLLGLCLCLAGVTPARAQDPPSLASQQVDSPPADSQQYDPPAHVSLVEGTAILERDGRTDDSPANMPLLAGDRIRTRDGRVEILFSDGSTLHLDAHTTVDFQSDELIRLLDGRIRLAIPGPSRQVDYRVDAQSGWAQIQQPGEYRLALTGARGGELELAVIRGAAELGAEGGRTPLRAGQRAYVSTGAAPSYAYVFNSATWDAFDRWSESRRNGRMAASAEYLPDEVRPYAASLDSYGTWRREPTHGYVWYPHVAVDWRPYYRGRWVTLPSYGWTWIGHDPWAWPTHHYGRWGFSAGVWFWIPGRSWGPAWVSWAYAPGYVSWSPLGWNNRPLIEINLFSRRDRWHPWTFVPHRYFGSGYVHARAVPYWGIDSRVRGSFSHGRRGPDYRDDRRRSAPPIRVAGTAVPRGRSSGAPLYTNIERGSRQRDDGRRIMVGPSGTPSRDRAPADAARGDNRMRAMPRDGNTAPPAASGSATRQRYEPRAPGLTRVPERGPDAPRADVPRYSRPNVRSVPPAPDGSSSGSPDRRAVPRRGADSGVDGSPAGRAPYAAPPSYSRPPSGDRPSYSRPPADDRPSYNAPRERRAPDAPQGAPGYRAVPRPVPDGGGPGRPAGVERRGPESSRPPSQAAPDRGGNRGDRGTAAEPGSRSRGGAAPTGGAARRRGGD